MNFLNFKVSIRKNAIQKQEKGGMFVRQAFFNFQGGAAEVIFVVRFCEWDVVYQHICEVEFSKLIQLIE